MWFVSCACVTTTHHTMWCVGSDFAEDTNDWEVSFFFWLAMLMISTSVVMLARFCYLSLNLSSLFRPLTRRQLWVTFIFRSLSEHKKGLDWLQSKYELRQSCSPTFPLTVSVTPSYHFQCLYHCFEFGEKASRGKKGSKTTAQGVYRLLDDLRSCYEAVCGFSLGARLWSSPPLVVVKQRSQSSRLFVRACRCRWAQSWEELSITGVSGSTPDTRVSNRWEMWSFKKSLKKNGTFVWEGCFLKRERPEWRLFPRLSSRQLVFLCWLFPTKPFIDKETLFKLN